MLIIPWKYWEVIGVTFIREAPYIRNNSHPFDKEIFFTGGSDEDIAEVLFEHMPILHLAFMHGNTRVTLDKPRGKLAFRFSREETSRTDESFVLSEN